MCSKAVTFSSFKEVRTRPNVVPKPDVVKSTMTFVWTGAQADVQNREFYIRIEGGKMHFSQFPNTMESANGVIVLPEEMECLPMFSEPVLFEEFCDQVDNGRYGVGGPGYLTSELVERGLSAGARVVDGILWMIASGFIFPSTKKYFINEVGWSYGRKQLYRWKDIVKEDSSIKFNAVVFKPLYNAVVNVTCKMYRDAVISDQEWSPNLHRIWCSYEFRERVRVFLLSWNRLGAAWNLSSNMPRRGVELLVIKFLASTDETCVTGSLKFFKRRELKCATCAWN